MRLKRTTALLLAGLMILTSIPANTLQAHAEEETAITQETEGSSVTEESSSDAEETITSAEDGTVDTDVSSEDEMSEVITDDGPDTEETSESAEEATATEEMTVTEEVTVTEESGKAEVALLGDATNLSDIKADSFAGGDGSEDDPYLIATKEQLGLFLDGGPDPSKALDSYYALKADIDVDGYIWNREAGFAGLDGGNFTISNVHLGDEMFYVKEGVVLKNLKIKTVTDDYALASENKGTISNVTVEDIITEESEEKDMFLAVFAVTNTGTISDCKIEGTVNTARSSFAGFVSTNGNGGTIDGCVNEISGISISNSGASYRDSVGIVLENHGTVKNCKMNASVSLDNSNYKFGGIVYNNQYDGIITDCITSSASVFKIGNDAGGIACYNYGSIKSCVNGADIDSGYFAGGIAVSGGDMSVNGTSYSPSIEDCENAGSVSGKNGAAGIQYTTASNTITDCNNTGDITSSGGKAAGIVAEASSEKIIVISNCINEGSINGSNSTAGIIAKPRNAELSNCINTGDITGGNYVGGIVAEKSGSSSSELLTMNKCANIGSVSSTSSTCVAVGGIGGSVHNFTMSETFSVGEINAIGTSGGSGGLIGLIGGSFTVTDCFANIEGNIERGNSGGLFGSYGYKGEDSVEQSVVRCYSACNLTNSSSHGGFAGYVKNTLESFGITDCYILGNCETVFGGWASDKTPAGVVKLGFTELSQDAFTNFDFTEKWVMDSTGPYPVLKWYPDISAPLHDIDIHDKDDEHKYTANGVTYDLSKATVLNGSEETVYGYEWEAEGKKTILLLRQDNIPADIMKNELKTCNTLVFGNDITDVTISVMTDTLNDNVNLEKVDLNKVKTIGKSSGTFAFGRCVNLDEVVNIGNLKYVSYGSFYMCKKLTAVDMPKCTYIGNQAFYECDSLVAVNVPKCEIIEDSAFARCDELTTVDISGLDSTKGIDEYGNHMNGKDAFRDCAKLSAVTLGAKCTELPDGIFEYYDGSDHSNVSTLKNIDLSHVTKCGQYSLAGTSIENLSLPNCTEIAFGSFCWCKNLKTIDIPKLTKLGGQTFWDIPQNLTITGGSKLTTIESSGGKPNFHISENGYTVTLDKAASDKLKKLDWKKANRTVIIEGSSSASTSLTLDKNTLALIKGETATITATVTPETSASSVKWTTSNKDIADVSGSGATAVVTAGSTEGTATITATLGKIKRTVTVTVSVPIKLDQNEMILTAKPGVTAELNANVSGAKLQTKNITWTSSDEDVLTVSSPGGKKAALTPSTAITEPKTVTVTAAIDDTDYSDVCTVTINPQPTVAVPVADIGSTTEPTAVKAGTFITLTSGTYGADIFYTVDGSDPVYDIGILGSNAEVYTDRIKISKTSEDVTNVTIKAVAIKDGYKRSDVVTYNYTIDEISADSWGDLQGDEILQSQFGDKASGVPDGVWYAINGKAYKESGYTNFALEYTGSKITFNDRIEVYCGNRRLCENRDYTVSYANNTNALEMPSGAENVEDDLKSNNAGKVKIPAVTIKGKGNYKDKAEFRFGIYKADINEAVFTSGDTAYIVAGSKVKLSSVKPAVALNGKTLKLNKDYELTYFYDTSEALVQEPSKEIVGAAGKTYTIQIKAKDGSNLTGVKEDKVTVTSVAAKADIPAGPVRTKMNKVKIAGLSTSVEYTGSEITLKDLFKADKVTKDPNGDKNESDAWEQVTLYTIDAKTKVKTPLKQYVEGLETPTEFATGDPNTADYEVFMSNTGVMGKFTLTFTGMNDYEGTLKKTITVKAYNVRNDARGVLIIDDIPAVDYVKTGAKPSVTVKYVTRWADESKTTPSEYFTLEEGIDYTLTYKNNVKPALSTIGKKAPTVTIKGKGNYTGANATKTFTINKANVKDNVVLTVADVIYNSKGKAGYFMPTPKIMDSGKAVSAGKNKDIEAIAKTAYKYYYAEDTDLMDDAHTPRYAGTEVLKTDKVAPGTRIKVTATAVVKSDNSPYNKTDDEGVTIEGYYNIIDTGKDISKMNAGLTKGVTISFHNGDELIPLKAEQITVMPKGKGAEALLPADYEIVSVVNNRFLGKATVTIRGRNGYGGTKTFTFKIGAMSMKVGDNLNT